MQTHLHCILSASGTAGHTKHHDRLWVCHSVFGWARRVHVVARLEQVNQLNGFKISPKHMAWQGAFKYSIIGIQQGPGKYNIVGPAFLTSQVPAACVSQQYTTVSMLPLLYLCMYHGKYHRQQSVEQAWFC